MIKKSAAPSKESNDGENIANKNMDNIEEKTKEKIDENNQTIKIANKTLNDQHFMVDKPTLKLIADSAELEEHDSILEIGFGKGALTALLAKKCKVIAVDIDPRFNFDDVNVTVVHDNILNCIDSLEFNKVAANIPYSISEPLLWKLLDKYCTRMVITFGINFAEIITNKDSKLGILTNAVYDTTLLKILPKKYFLPEPRTDSAIVLFKPKSDLTKIEEITAELVRQDDKKIKNALESIFMETHTKKQIKTILDAWGHKQCTERNIRMMSNEDFLLLLELIETKLMKN
jgi:16S rRNA (adenine1518-N6/adenine1519-N6)-dimethyltransferase